MEKVSYDIYGSEYSTGEERAANGRYTYGIDGRIHQIIQARFVPTVTVKQRNVSAAIGPTN